MAAVVVAVAGAVTVVVVVVTAAVAAVVTATSLAFGLPTSSEKSHAALETRLGRRQCGFFLRGFFCTGGSREAVHCKQFPRHVGRAPMAYARVARRFAAIS